MTGPVTNPEGLRIALPYAVLHVLDLAQPARGALTLRRVSLTFPNAALVDWPSITPGAPDTAAIVASWAWQAADLFASQIEAESAEHAGALLVLDLAPGTLRPHWYGYALTERNDFTVDQLWRSVVFHAPLRSQLKHRVRSVTGQAGPWSAPSQVWTADADAVAKHATLRENVHRTCRYACKELPDGVTLPLTERIVLSGSFERVLGRFISPTVGNASAQLAAQLGRTCRRCGDTLPVAKRSHAKSCGPTCRKLASKAKRKAERAEVSP